MSTNSHLKASPISSSIHGIQYIVDSKSQKFVRIFWLIIFVLSIIGFMFYVYIVYSKWMLTPDIGITVDFKPVRSIPFPAVTICAPMSIKNKYADFKKVYHELNTNGFKNGVEIDQQEMISAIVQSCDPNLSTFFSQKIKKSASNNFNDLLLSGSFTVKEAFYQCFLNSNIRKNCSDMFNQVITEDGICYSFNMQGYNTLFNKNSVDDDFDIFIRKSIKNIRKNQAAYFDDNFEKVKWTLQKGYTSNDDAVFPLRIISGNSIEFTLMHPKIETNNYCPALRNSYKIIFHMPNEIPTKFHDYIYASMDTQFLISMKAKHFVTDSSLKKYNPDIRRCYYDNERKLKFFKSYTKAHCDLECLANHTKKVCGCVKFSMPRSPETPICNLDETVCYNDAIQHWPHDEKHSSKEDFPSFSVPCDCFPPCNDIKYSTKLVDHVNIDSLLNTLNYNGISNYSDISVKLTSIKIIFEEFLADEQTHFVAYKLENFIAECGGLLGLFMGCSMLSIVELFYLCFRKLSKNVNVALLLKPKQNRHDASSFSQRNRVLLSHPMHVRNLQKRNAFQN